MLARIFINRPVLACVFSIVILLSVFGWDSCRESFTSIEAGIQDANAGRVEAVEDVRRSFGLPE